MNIDSESCRQNGQHSLFPFENTAYVILMRFLTNSVLLYYITVNKNSKYSF